VHAGNIVPGDDALDDEHAIREPADEKSGGDEAGQLDVDEAPPMVPTAE
jgi:hypothetical protein